MFYRQYHIKHSFRLHRQFTPNNMIQIMMIRPLILSFQSRNFVICPPTQNLSQQLFIRPSAMTSSMQQPNIKSQRSKDQSPQSILKPSTRLFLNNFN